MFDNFGAVNMTASHSHDNLKKDLLKEIKREKWRETVTEEDYEENSKIFDEIQRKNLETIIKQNRRFRSRSRNFTKKETSKKWRNISVEARDAYDKWKANYKKKPCPEVSVKNLLLILHYLNANPEPPVTDRTGLQECMRQQDSDFEIFWDSPTCILQALRKCILTRDWLNMTYFSLILLNYDKKYVHIVKNMCRIMVKFNPLVKQYGLEEQFKTLSETVTTDLVVV